jgi:uncharacterized protein YcgI (DUF1989 family)
MNIPWTGLSTGPSTGPSTGAGALSFEEPLTKPGDYVVLRAEMDLVIAFSACPQDILPINGRAGQPTEAHFQIL